MKLLNVVQKITSKLYMDKKVSADIQKIKDESGLQEIDWRAFLQEKNKYPAEVQTVIEAQNQDHVKLYDEDIENIDKIMEETKNMISSEIPECVHMHYLDGSIEFHKQVNLECIASSTGRCETSFSTKLLYAQPYLYGDTSEVDINIEAQAIYNSFLTLREESEKNVRIAQKGKSGEDYVSKILNQYRNKFFILENIVIPAYEEKGNTSETDVYIISSKGIFVCEVKNYGSSGQTLYIPEHGDWKILNSSGQFLANKPSAFEQNERHCNATRSFIKEHLGIEVPIIPVVIIANDVVDVTMENPEKDIVIRANQINELVSGFQDALTFDIQTKIVEAFENNKLDPNDFPVKINADRANYVKGLIKEYIPYMKANAKIADTYMKAEKQSRLISWAIIVLAALLFMIPAFEEGLLGVILGGVCVFLLAMTSSTIGLILALVAAGAYLVVLNTGSTVALVVYILAAFLCEKFTLSNNE